jgi:hypothetical protein
MRLDGLGKPPLAQAQSDNIDKTKVQLHVSKEVNQAPEASDLGSSASEREHENGRLGQILDLVKKAQDRKKKKKNPKLLSEALKNYQRAASALDEAEPRLGQTLDVKI